MYHANVQNKNRKGALVFLRTVIAVLCGVLTVVSLTSCMMPETTILIPSQEHKGILLIKGSIKGTGPYDVFIDTGVDPSVVDLSKARELGLPVDESMSGKAEGSGDGQGLTVMRASIEGLTLKGREIRSIEALAADLSSFASALDSDLALILGYSFLKDRVVRFDYRSNEIAITDSTGSLPPPTTPVTTAHRVPLKPNSEEDMIPIFEIWVHGEAVMVSLDTGKSGGVEFYGSAIDRLGLRQLADAGTAERRQGARGGRTVSAGTLDVITVGPFDIENVKVSFSDKMPKNGTREGNAGNAFLRNFVVTVDYVNGELIFER